MAKREYISHTQEHLGENHVEHPDRKYFFRSALVRIRDEEERISNAGYDPANISAVMADRIGE